jgi:peptidoglycan hydrolase-like protein with peptidoglycan-binding domain
MTVRRTSPIRRLERTGHHEIVRRTSPTDDAPTGHRFSHDFRQVRLSSAEPPVTFEAETEEAQQGESLQSEEVEATRTHPTQRVLSGSWLVQRQEGASGSASIFDEITAEAAALRPGLPTTFADYRQRIQSATFLGVSISGGVDQEMAGVLQRAERELNFTPGSRNQHGVYQIGGMDASRLHGLHSWGLAIDINTPTNPYIMHEAGEAQLDQQLAPVYDRIAWFILGRSSVIPRQIQQSSGGSREQRIGDMYDRLAEESQAMQTYFRYMQNVAELEQYLSTPEGYERYLLITHTTEPDRSMPPDIEALRRQMMADFAVLTSRPGPVIQPIENEQAGASVAPPLTYPHPERLEGRQDRPFDRGGSRRTPLRGFLDLEREVVMALTRAGLRWGACELGAESGDIMHFDMALQPLGQAVFQAIRTVKARHRSSARPAQRMTASSGDAVPDVSPAIESDIDAMRGGGAPLDPTTRAFMEPRFGHDFSRVRVHTDARAATVARSLDALAFTVGDDIAFAPGQYRPGSDEGRALLAHELTHTIQQTGGAARVQRQDAGEDHQSDGDQVQPPVSLSNPRFTPIPALRQIAEGRRTLSTRDNGRPVKAVQTALLDLGYSLLRFHDDGRLGGETRDAVHQFRRDHGIAPGNDVDYTVLAVLDRVAPPPGQATGHFVDYERLLADDRLDFSISLGYDEGQSHVADAEAARQWLAGQGFALASGSIAEGDERYEMRRDITYPDAQGQQATKNVLVTLRLITPGEGAARRFLETLNDTEIMTYVGHARGGLGPDFDDKHSARENVVIGAHSRLHDRRDTSVRTPRDPYWRTIESERTNTLEEMTDRGAWDENRYRVWLFYACTSLNYQDELRGGLLPPSMNRENLDIFGTNKSVPIAAGLEPTFAMIEGILNAQTMEQIVAAMQQRMEDALRAQPNVTQPQLRDALREYRDAFYREGAGDNPVAE